ncbi:YbhB/YbcL family Raf kinase inhibitor-like protein [Lysobacter claricitrinus]|uniref:YbhB/YbcL family Raf kinase inhibitor-like protein n=1 Tax=Lysobacter claricitrinus TaxID=3367728 RepID=UPI0037DBADDC
MNARRVLLPCLLAAALLVAMGPARGQPAPTGSPSGPALREGASPAPAPLTATAAKSVAIERIVAASAPAITVTSPQIRARTAIAPHHTAYGDNVSPALAWTPVNGAKTYVLLVEDPDAPRAQPFAHWVAWNIPAGVHALPEGVPTQASPTAVRGMQQGHNGRNATGYFGPRPPAGDPPHHYHFQVFALDRALTLAANATRDDVVAAMHGHVIAKGELVATSQAPTSH